MARHLFHLQHKTNHYDNNHFNVLPPKNRRHIYTSTVISCVCLTRLRDVSRRAPTVERDHCIHCGWIVIVGSVGHVICLRCQRQLPVTVLEGMYIIYTEWWADIFSSGRGGKNPTQKWVPIEKKRELSSFFIGPFLSLYIYTEYSIRSTKVRD